MVQNYNAAGDAWAGQWLSNPSLWSLPVEVELYLVYPIFFWLLRRMGARTALSAAALGSLIAGILSATIWPWLMANFLLYWLIWCGGAWLAELYTARRLPKWSAAHWIVFGAAMGTGFFATLKKWDVALLNYVWAVAGWLLFLWGLIQPEKTQRTNSRILQALAFVGTFSYSLYLIHYPFFRISGEAWKKFFGGKPSNVLIPYCFAGLAVFLAWGFYRLIEAPSHRLARDLAGKRKEKAIATPANALVLLCLLFSLNARAEIIDPRMHHLGVAGQPEWDEFRDVPVEGPRFDLRFTAHKNTDEWTLFLRQRDVKVVWRIELNGRAFTNLFLSEDDLVNAFALPVGLLQEGTNTLSIIPPKERDDIEVGEIRFENKRFGEAQVEVKVGMPCRVTVVDAKGSLAPLRIDSKFSAARPGVVYLGAGEAVIHLAAGDYTIYAGRGFEYSVSSEKISLKAGETKSVRLNLQREVSTPGLVASDTHVHTYTWSRHGDATELERAITLAGEGIELPIATDHNLVIDPVAPAKATGMDRYYTPVFGDEVTTSHAHFNIFPVQPGAKAPNWKIDDWPKLMEEMRAAPGVRVVILNHPRNIHNNFQPFAATNFNAKTGENLRGFEFSFDAVEVVNSSALQTDWMLNFRDWMALLNYGYRVTGVGSSDVHDVSRYIVGQSRSYISVEDSDPAHIDVNKACDAFLSGRVLISMGLLADMKVNGKYSVGDLATDVPSMIPVTVSVQGPGWTAVDLVQLYANGELVREERFAQIKAPGEKKRITWNLPKPARDIYLVAIASGPPVRAPYWRIPKPYQPTSTTWNPRVVGATNPIWIDADGDGIFTALRLQPAGAKNK